MLRPGGADPRALAEMNAALVHRGPDSDGQFVSGPVGLAARRLSIIDLDHGDQPIGNEDGRSRWSRTARSTTTRRCAASSSGPGTGFAPAATRRPSCTSTRSTDSTSPSGSGACSRWPSGTPGGDAGTGPRPLRNQAALLPRAAGALAFASELKALRRRRVQPRGGPGRARLVPHFNSIPAPMTIFREARKLPPVTCWSPGSRRSCALCGPAPATRSCGRGRGRPDELRGRLRDSVRAHLSPTCRSG